MGKIPIVIDTDPGIDDFFALMLARSAEIFDIRAIQTVAGNQVIEKVTDNTLRICQMLDIRTRLSKGAEKPILGEQITAGYIHGSNGLGDLQLEKGDFAVENIPAWDLMYEEARNAEGDLRIIALGPLTNIAIALLKYPDIKNFIKEIILMGGSTGLGNVSVYGEFNIVADPVAADIVFKSGIPLTMVGLNVTHQTILSEEDIEELLAIPCKFQKEITHLLRFAQKTEKEYGFNGVILHDPLTVAYAMDPTVLTLKSCPVSIETRSGLNRGRTVADLDPWRKDALDRVNVAVEVDKAKFVEMLKNMLRYWA
jgi:pyrimidine-specific ribonucleoside hydrolase rihA